MMLSYNVVLVYSRGGAGVQLNRMSLAKLTAPSTRPGRVSNLSQAAARTRPPFVSTKLVQQLTVTVNLTVFDHCLWQDVARGILPSWTAIAQRRREMPFSDEQRKWQLLR
jgi:hypothetical protein